ncbi:DUF427 domain-containing protein [Tunicatimonas pelagia]|uniref:DUF427 domain-containing protein n=1 Tax=Tunicatimonas pelagia TaxID=931531 RepID=UPI0026654EF6|nr:DUF427 domain-containing protein [Tunicatimonas pelagia]WKN45213.1 DUF427 domain-containing protein [Tunicatimonas pelagia]
MKAIFNDQVIAESDQTEVVEGNHYFPPESIKWEYFTESNMQTTCPWKGEASYYNLGVEGEVAKDVAWYYPSPKDAAQQIKGHVAFYPNKVEVKE